LSTSRPDLLIVGAGLSGLSCAVHARSLGLAPLVLEAAARPGGRAVSDRLDGFVIDRGFQVLLDSYPEVQRLGLDRRLSLRPYRSGALVRFAGRFHRTGDPWRRPLDALAAALSPVGTLRDKLAVAAWRRAAVDAGPEAAAGLPETTARERLRALGIGDSLVDRFFRPFFGGVFLDLELGTSSRMLDFLFPLFATGSACVPAGGMADLPAALVSRLPEGSVRVRAAVELVHPSGVDLIGGEHLEAGAVVVAAPAGAARRLLGDCVPERTWNGACCLTFAADHDPLGEPVLALDGDGVGPVTNFTVPSTVSPSLAPPGAHLLCAAIVGSPSSPDRALEEAVRGQLRGWFGPVVRGWRTLRIQRIPHALPTQPPGSLTPWRRPVEVRPGLFACGDWVDNASIDGALASGRRAAEAAAAHLGRCPA
jgi:phytoene dehydrogenase-like protein